MCDETPAGKTGFWITERDESLKPFTGALKRNQGLENTDDCVCLSQRVF